MNAQENNIFHGSMRDITGKLVPHKGRNTLGGESFNQFAIYATPHFLTAVVYSLSVERARLFSRKEVLIAYGSNQLRVKMKGCYWSRKNGFVYVIPASSFQTINEFEWFSSSEVPILQKLIITPTDVDKLIASKNIILESDPPPKKEYRWLLTSVEMLVRCTSYLRQCFWTLISRLM